MKSKNECKIIFIKKFDESEESIKKILEVFELIFNKINDDK